MISSGGPVISQVQYSQFLGKDRIIDSTPVSLTCLDNFPIIHQDEKISFLQQLGPVSAEDPGPVPQNTQNAFLHEMRGHVRIYCSQGVIQQINILLLRRK